MLIQRSHLDGRERLMVRDPHDLIILERDEGGSRVVSWTASERHELAVDQESLGRSCASSCRRASQDARPVPVRLTIDRQREVVHWWSMILNVMAERPKVCSQCSLLTRWCGLFWCGVPAPVRMWRRLAVWLASITWIATGANVGGDVGGVAVVSGCGCNLNVKWRLLETPRAMVRRLAALLLLALTGEAVELESDEAACPYGLWPSAL